MVSNPNLCHTLSDLYGPYDTKKECEQRAYEIAKELPEYMPAYIPMKYKCSDPWDKRVDKESI